MPRTAASHRLGRRIVKGARLLRSLPAAVQKDIEDFPSVIYAFRQHLHAKHTATTVTCYTRALQRLFELHRRAPTAMATAKYLEAVRSMEVPFSYTAAVTAYCKSQGLDVTANGRVAPSKQKNPGREVGKKQTADAPDAGQAPKRRRTARDTRSLAHLEDASPRDIENFPRIAASFRKRLFATFPEVTATQYSQNINRLFRIHGKSPQAMGSSKYLEAVQRLGLRAAQVAAVKAFCKFRGTEFFLDTGAKRKHANIEARRRLVLANKQGRHVSDADVLAVLRLWAFEQNRNRPNVLPKGKKWVYSATLGLIRDRTGHLMLSSCTKDSKDVMRLLCRWLCDSLGHTPFPFTSISLNKDYAAALHRDKGNAGPSVGRAVGDFQGGQLRYWHGVAPNVELALLKRAGSAVLDVRHGPVFFDGNYPHCVEPFSGERFSAVFFTAGGYHQAPVDARTRLRSLGVHWPSKASISNARRVVAEVANEAAAAAAASSA